MLAVSLWRPALSQAPANLDFAVTEVGLDWIFLNPYPLINSWGPGQTWAMTGGPVDIAQRAALAAFQA